MENNLNIKLGENDIKKSDVDRVNILLKQMSSKAVPIDIERIEEVMSHGKILTMRDSDKEDVLIGIATLIPIRKLFSFCGTVEDVVVDKAYRGQGLGKKIMESIIQKSQSMGMKFVELTSSSQRVAANGLYQSMGFEKRETNVYRRYN